MGRTSGSKEAEVWRRKGCVIVKNSVSERVGWFDMRLCMKMTSDKEYSMICICGT